LTTSPDIKAGWRSVSLIWENALSSPPAAIMSVPDRIPKVLAEKFAAITALTDAFCARHLNEEYRRKIHRVVAALARRRPSPLLKGKENVWAAAAVHAVGRVNFLDDPSQTPHCKPNAIYEFLGLPEAPGRTSPGQYGSCSKWGPVT
jgi:Domain of unknown function (DUF6398)